jgi:hypothetical protein
MPTISVAATPCLTFSELAITVPQRGSWIMRVMRFLAIAAGLVGAIVLLLPIH